MRACLFERLLGKQEALQTQARELRRQGQRIGQGINDQVVLVGALAQEGPAVVDVDVYSWIGEWLLRMELPAQAGDNRVDLNCVDMTDLAVLQADGRVR